MFFTVEEFKWLQQWLAIKAALKGREKNSFLLFTKGKGPSKNLNTYMRLAWREMGLQGEINFTLIRTAIATYAKQLSKPTDGKKVAEFMCHDTRTADKFYARNPDITEASAIRQIFTSSLEELPSTSVTAGTKRKRRTEEKQPRQKRISSTYLRLTRAAARTKYSAMHSPVKVQQMKEVSSKIKSTIAKRRQRMKM
ncbi:uncharacterized protein LOC121633523 isoform X1 [Melanotaenia boesemani]|uniref:uncharacterized protein LOC121633523 isoform X1 n=1 Tax=Melanotaenia boesemani TaxID=1250792 RepID=UPI001C05A2FD|nr:uncharacterized protein LOC121633523 isoform X1 [Melanotaenia boesemani]XP_041831570.1 uncharacterized protein LOC121633523 isoform X1 [Melanotaenia boesemani]